MEEVEAINRIGWPVKEILCIGAEAFIFKIDFFGEDAVLKIRIKKDYRDPKIDSMIRMKRTQTESFLLNKVKTVGIPAPTLLFLDLNNHYLILEYIKGVLLKNALRTGKVDWRKVAIKMGEDVAKMHEIDIVHGDLTTSNIFCTNSGLIYFDFGLGEITKELEDKAVDIELLYRVMRSTHPEISDRFMEEFLRSYRGSYSAAPDVISRYKRIRLMGRYVVRSKRA